jgi:glycosyltransferase involved in cell wall biosynthesis
VNNQLNILLLDCAPFTGGAQKSFWSLVSKLPESGCSPLLMAADGLTEQTRNAAFPCRTFTARHWPASLKGLWQYWQDSRTFVPLFDETIANFTPSLVHANCIRSALLLPVDCRLPILLHDRDIRFPFFFVRLVANRFPNLHVVAISPLVAEKWRGLLPNDRLHIVPNGFDLQAIANTQPAAKNDSASFRLLQVADFSPWKRHDRFLSLLAQLKPQIPGLKAVIKGRIRDPQGEQLLNNLKRTASTLGLDDILSFNTADESALPEIAAADVVVSCSDSEPFGRVIVEALALGKPVVSCIGGGLDSFLSDCPAFMAVPPEKHQDAILQWLPVEKRQAANLIAQKAAEAFSIERHVADIVEIYRQIAP